MGSRDSSISWVQKPRRGWGAAPGGEVWMNAGWGQQVQIITRIFSVRRVASTQVWITG